MPLRGGGRSVSAEPVCSCAHFLMHIARETAGAARTRSSPRPLFLEGEVSSKTSGALRRENAKSYLSVVIPGRCEASNPEARDSPGCNCTPEVWSFGPSRNDGSTSLQARRQQGVLLPRTLHE